MPPLNTNNELINYPKNQKLRTGTSLNLALYGPDRGRSGPLSDYDHFL